MKKCTTRLLIPSLLLTGLLSCGETEQSVEAPLRPVRYIAVEKSDATRARVFSGTTKSTVESRLSFKVAGTILELPVKAGDPLQKGQLIARLDASAYELQAQQAKASLAQAQANERNAAANYQRVRELYSNFNASRNDLDSARAAAESAQAQVAAAQKQLELAQLNASYTRLEANSDCSVADVSVEINENVAAGTTIATVNCGEDLQVDISVPESLIGDISIGLTASATFPAIPNRQFSGIVSEVGLTPGGASTTFPVTIALHDHEPQLRAGLAAEVTLQLRRASGGDLILVPAHAVAEDEMGRFVFLVQETDTAGVGLIKRRNISVGDLTDEGLEITSGLQSGDHVVTAGMSVIFEGLRVKL